MTVAALVPMKGHSERVPRKNLRTIAGKPLFHWVTKTLLDTSRVDLVVVDTDSDEIEIAVTSAFPDVRVHRRPEHLHGDIVSMHDIVANVVESLSHDIVLQTHSTNPLLTAATVDRAIEAFLDSDEYDSLMSVTALQTRLFFEDGRPVNHQPGELIRTQDLSPILEENSNIYIAPRGLVLRTGRRVGKNPLLFRIDRAEAIDIDDQVDFEIAEFLLEKRHG